MGVIQGSINQFLALTGAGATALNKQAQANLSEYRDKSVSELNEFQARREAEGEIAISPIREKVASLDPNQESTAEAKAKLREAEDNFGALSREIGEDRERVVAVAEGGKKGGFIGALKARKNIEEMMSPTDAPTPTAVAQRRAFTQLNWQRKAIDSISREQQRKALYDKIMEGVR